MILLSDADAAPGQMLPSSGIADEARKLLAQLRRHLDSVHLLSVRARLPGWLFAMR